MKELLRIQVVIYLYIYHPFYCQNDNMYNIWFACT
jgi:hypothetical protein